jgi:hypothetical protein
MRRRLLAAVILFAIIALFSVVLAQSGQFDLPWHTIDSGGGTSSGGDFALRAAVGQPESGSLSGGDYAVDGGFLALPLQGAIELGDVYLPLVFKPA